MWRCCANWHPKCPHGGASFLRAAGGGFERFVAYVGGFQNVCLIVVGCTILYYIAKNCRVEVRTNRPGIQHFSFILAYCGGLGHCLGTVHGWIADCGEADRSAIENKAVAVTSKVRGCDFCSHVALPHIMTVTADVGGATHGSFGFMEGHSW